MGAFSEGTEWEKKKPLIAFGIRVFLWHSCQLTNISQNFQKSYLLHYKNFQIEISWFYLQEDKYWTLWFLFRSSVWYIYFLYIKLERFLNNFILLKEISVPQNFACLVCMLLGGVIDNCDGFCRGTNCVFVRMFQTKKAAARLRKQSWKRSPNTWKSAERLDHLGWQLWSPLKYWHGGCHCLISIAEWLLLPHNALSCVFVILGILNHSPLVVFPRTTIFVFMPCDSCLQTCCHIAFKH